MARALAKDSDIFPFDEPLSNLDAKLCGQMRAELLSCMAAIFSSKAHQRRCSKNPNNKFVAGFLGSLPMNFLQADLRKEEDTLFAVGDAFKIAIPTSKSKELGQTSGTSPWACGPVT